MTNYLLIVFSVFAGVCGHLLLKHGMTKIGYIEVSVQQVLKHLGEALLSPFIIFGLIMFFIGALSYLVVLSRVELSWAQPLAAMSYIFILGFSWLLFQEEVGLIKVFGVLTIVIGVILITRS